MIEQEKKRKREKEALCTALVSDSVSAIRLESMVCNLIYLSQHFYNLPYPGKLMRGILVGSSSKRSVGCRFNMAPMKLQLLDIISACFEIADIKCTQYDLERGADTERDLYTSAQYAAVSSTIVAYGREIGEIQERTVSGLNNELEHVYDVTKTLLERLTQQGCILKDEGLIGEVSAEIPQCIRDEWISLVKAQF